MFASTILADSPLLILAAIVALIVMPFVGFLILLSSQYKRCPSNKLMVVYGKTKHGTASRTLHGGAAFVVPLVQDCAYLSLEPIQIEVSLRGITSSDNDPVGVSGVFNVAIGTQPSLANQAAVRLLGLSMPQIHKQAEAIIVGQLRQMIGSVTVEEINRFRDKSLQRIQQSLESELAKIGMELINVDIADVTVESEDVRITPPQNYSFSEKA